MLNEIFETILQNNEVKKAVKFHEYFYWFQKLSAEIK